MSHHVFFMLSTSLSKTLRVPKGTHQRIIDHLREVEETLGLKRTPTYTPEGEKQQPGWHWRDTEKAMREKLGPKSGM